MPLMVEAVPLVTLLFGSRVPVSSSEPRVALPTVRSNVLALMEHLTVAPSALSRMSL